MGEDAARLAVSMLYQTKKGANSSYDLAPFYFPAVTNLQCKAKLSYSWRNRLFSRKECLFNRS
ncbi:hypothetical protein VCRA2117O380_10516 [Vibrio crassostreae]|nr:hypothetical protein VCRA2117O379_10138 [Vibrio crassostreae]CAK1863196.1 hypothetical protein VCRA2119O381_10006 [Vibrio crassostreae]CAK1896587.1 hypothetical protein VCRA2119O382_10516 [Vibrio crassostreae]CAK1898474.1 hypothetical protein VCRA2117O380_10516 [Vibrio crassostreae]CAK2444393.1 hypothetical protein VCRA2113O350_10138 [Vibrio crassostreae]